MKSKSSNSGFIRLLQGLLYLIVLLPFFLLFLLAENLNLVTEKGPAADSVANKPYEIPLWQPMTMEAVIHEKDPEMIKYGRELVANTAQYLGPKGTVAPISNGMNCQNCHLDAGTRPWGNNYGAVLSTYPKMRARSGSIESIEKRVNDCFERSLNGKALDTSSKELKAIVSYIKFIGKYVEKDSIPSGTGIWKLKYMSRAASPEKGEPIYAEKCASCHGGDGQGIKNAEGTAFTYPPLWGPQSYNQGAGLFRLSRLAGYIKTNMPFGTTYEKPQLSDEECWDVAAFINTRLRPSKDLSKDWPDISKKPVDHPFGPFSDPFPEIQHKLGPFKPIDDFKKSKK